MKALNAEPVDVPPFALGGGGGGGGGGLPDKRALCHTHLMVIGLVLGAAFVFLCGWGFGEYRSQR